MSRTRARYVVLETIYHQGDGSPTATESRYTEWIGSDEQPYLRNTTVGAEWKRLDTGWIEDGNCSLLAVRNCEPPARTSLTPVPAPRLTNVLEVGLAVGDAVVPIAWLAPEKSLRLAPAAPLTAYRIRAVGAAAVRYRLLALPR